MAEQTNVGRVQPAGLRKPFVREVSRTRWFFRRPRYMRYMAREVTCIFIGVYTMLLVVGLARLAEGRAAYEAFLQSLQGPASIALLVIALLFSAYHSITWFNLTPKALPLQIGGKFVPDAVIAGAHYIACAIASAVVLYAAGVF
jgi:fumarate reductase subunit C